MLVFVRIGLPALIVLGGIVAIAVGGADETSLEGGGAIIGAGLAVALLNVFYRVGVQGDRTREQEEAARAFYDEHGHWPDEPPPPRGEQPRRAPPT